MAERVLPPLGIFDSGLGGLTVASAMMDMMPHESIHYVGDTLNGPYGPLPIADVRRHALTIMDQLVDDGVKLLVIACNTASAAVLRDARERFARTLDGRTHGAAHVAVTRRAALGLSNPLFGGSVTRHSDLRTQSVRDALGSAPPYLCQAGLPACAGSPDNLRGAPSPR